MKNEYKHTKTTVSLLNYHLVFCPRYRRKIFQIPGVEQRFKELTAQECQAQNIDILAMECHVDHVHMFVSAYPQQSIPDIMRQIKGATSHKLQGRISTAWEYAQPLDPELFCQHGRQCQFRNH